MVILAIRIEHSLNVAVQGPLDADPREHDRPAGRRDQDQGFHGRQPLWGHMLGLGEPRNVLTGILQGDELANRAAAGLEGRMIVSKSMRKHRHPLLKRRCDPLNGAEDA